MNRIAISCMVGAALLLPGVSVRSQGEAEPASVKTTTQPDEVAVRIMEKPIYPIGIHTVAFSPDGRIAAGGDGTGHLRLWEVATGNLVHDIAAHSNWVFAIHWHRDGGSIVTGGGDNLIHWFDAAEPEKPIWTVKAHSNDVHAVVLSHDGDTLYSAGDDRQIVIWDVKKDTAKRRITGHTRQIPALVLSPNGRALASGSRDHSIRLWNARNGKERDTLVGHTGDVMALSFSPDGVLLASAGWDHTVRLWEVRSGKAVRIISGEVKRVSGVAFSRDGKRVVSSGGADLRMFQVETGKEIWSAKFTSMIRDSLGKETPEDLSAVAFSPGGEQVAVGSTTGRIYLVDAETGQVIREFSAPENK